MARSFFTKNMEEAMQKATEKTQDAQRAYVRVIDYIKQEIRDGHLHIGSRLPPERTLAEHLNVSRNSVREALRILEIMGTTVSTQGAGHFIAGNFENSLVESLSIMFLLKELTFQQVSQLRYALEKQAFALAVEHIAPEDLSQLQSIISRLDLGVSEEENVLLDKRLHYTIARASGNVLFVSILNALSDVMDRFIADLRMDIMAEENRREKLFAAHRRIVECILEKDVSGGFQAIDEHFRLIDERLEVCSRSVQL